MFCCTTLQTLMLDLARSLEDRQDSANLQIAVLSFINVIINYKAGEVSFITPLRTCQQVDGRACMIDFYRKVSSFACTFDTSFYNLESCRLLTNSEHCIQSSSTSKPLYYSCLHHFRYCVCRHLEIFELVRLEDERGLTSRLEIVSFNNNYHQANNRPGRSIRKYPDSAMQIYQLQLQTIVILWLHRCQWTTAA